MAKWTNIFELGEWDIYVQYAGVNQDPDPNSSYYWVRADELDPRVGTVTVEDGVIVAEFEEPTSSGGVQPGIAVMPRGWGGVGALARVSALVDGGSFWMNEGYFQEVSEVSPRSGPAGTYRVSSGVQYVEIRADVIQPGTELPGQIEQGSGLYISNYEYGS